MEKHPPSVRDIPHASQDIISIRSYNTSASTVCVCVVGSGCTGNSYNVLFTIEPTAKQISVSRRQELSPFRFIQVNFLSLIHYYRLTRVNARNNGLLCCYCLDLVDVEAFFFTEEGRKHRHTVVVHLCFVIQFLFIHYSFESRSIPSWYYYFVSRSPHQHHTTHERTNECCY